MARLIIISFCLLIHFQFVHGGESVRLGEPHTCFMFEWGKGSEFTAAITEEFQIAFCQKNKPDIEKTSIAPAKGLKWTNNLHAPAILELARKDGRRIYQITYGRIENERQKIETVMLVMETESDSGWFAPFCVLLPESNFSAVVISGKDYPFALMARLHFSGTGGFTAHHLFDMNQAFPQYVGVFHSGRVRRGDYETEEEYQNILKKDEILERTYRGER